MIYGDIPVKWNESPSGENELPGVNTCVYMPDFSAIKQSGNLYAYVTNNPVRYIDPTGEFATVATIAGIALWKIVIVVAIAITVAAMTETLVDNPPRISTISTPKKEVQAKTEAKTEEKDIAKQKPRRNPTHHIVAKADPRAAEARAILRDVGIEPVTDS